jgi:hypothetical protein
MPPAAAAAGNAESVRAAWYPGGGWQRAQSSTRTALTAGVRRCDGQLPDDLLSRNTLKNIEKNKERTDYCVTTFKYISNRYLLSRDFCPTGAVSVSPVAVAVLAWV